jgi:hypothetical protein
MRTRELRCTNRCLNRTPQPKLQSAGLASVEVTLPHFAPRAASCGGFGVVEEQLRRALGAPYEGSAQLCTGAVRTACYWNCD